MDLDWQQMLIPSTSVLEIVVRGTIIYLVLFAAFRLLPRRTAGGMGPSDLLVLVLIADAVQNGMSDGYESITEAIVLAATIILWAQVIDWIDYRFPQLRLAAAAPREVVRNGQIVWNNLKREQVSEEELRSQLRQQGLDSTEEIVAAYIEGDGHLSILRRGRERIRRKESPAT